MKSVVSLEINLLPYDVSLNEPYKDEIRCGDHVLR